MFISSRAMNQSQLDWWTNGTLSQEATAAWPTAAYFHAQVHDLEMHQQPLLATDADAASSTVPDASATAALAGSDTSKRSGLNAELTENKHYGRNLGHSHASPVGGATSSSLLLPMLASEASENSQYHYYLN